MQAGQASTRIVVLASGEPLDPDTREALTGGEFILATAPEHDRPELVLAHWARASRAELSTLPAAGGHAHVPLVVLLAEAPTAHSARTLMARADGVVMAGEAPQTLVLTLRAVLAGQLVHPRSWREILDRPLLSAREKQVLAMVVLGLTNGEIAAKLHVTESNVKFHLTSSFRKLGVTSREQATALILDPDAGLGPGILRIVPDED